MPHATLLYLSRHKVGRSQTLKNTGSPQLTVTSSQSSELEEHKIQCIWHQVSAVSSSPPLRTKPTLHATCSGSVTTLRIPWKEEQEQDTGLQQECSSTETRKKQTMTGSCSSMLQGAAGALLTVLSPAVPTSVPRRPSAGFVGASTVTVAIFCLARASNFICKKDFTSLFHIYEFQLYIPKIKVNIPQTPLDLFLHCINTIPHHQFRDISIFL